MKKFLCIILLFIFAACGGSQNDERVLDFRSMRDTELDVIISLGDSRARLESLLGEPIHESALPDNAGFSLRFAGGMDIILRDGGASFIYAENTSSDGRFEIYGYSIGMNPEQIGENIDFNEALTNAILDVPSVDSAYVFRGFFDARGNSLGGGAAPPGAAAVGHTIKWVEEYGEASIVLTVMSWE